MKTRKKHLGLVLIFGAALALGASGCIVAGEPMETAPVATSYYTPMYYNGYVVYYDGYGRPMYYANGYRYYVPSTYAYYGHYVSHYRRYGLHYNRWYRSRGHRYHRYRLHRNHRRGYRRGYRHRASNRRYRGRPGRVGRPGRAVRSGRSTRSLRRR